MLIFFHQYADQLTNTFSRSTIGTYVKVALVFLLLTLGAFLHTEKKHSSQGFGNWDFRCTNISPYQGGLWCTIMCIIISSLSQTYRVRRFTILCTKLREIILKSALLVPQKNIFLSIILFFILLNSGKVISKKLQ